MHDSITIAETLYVNMAVSLFPPTRCSEAIGQTIISGSESGVSGTGIIIVKLVTRMVAKFL
jgi:hypothetical protein